MILALSLVLAAAASPALQSDRASDLGSVRFETSGAPAAQAPFVRGVLLLHSFEYEDAADEFRAAQAADPAFALAYWGEALTHSHPIWGEEDRDAARAVLERLAPTRAERLAKAPTERERGFLAAVEELFGEGELAERNRAYCRAMEDLRARFPDDLEVAAFTALALLGTSENGRQIPIYMRAAAVAEEVYAANPLHPGGLHYAIHCYDDPVHAPLGLRMARTYAAVAPAAQHALHMPSHIFVALGMWEESAAANVDSAAAADDRRARKGLGVGARGFHSLYWLLYSDLQLGRRADARRLLDDMVRDAERGAVRTRYHLAAMRATYLVGTGAWSDGELDAIAVDVDGIELPAAAADLYARGTSALARGDVPAAEGLLARMAALRAALADELGGDVVAAELAAPSGPQCCRPAAGAFSDLAPGRRAAVVMEAQLEGRIARARGDARAAEELLREAARGEDAMGYDFGPPVVVEPAHELLGELLLELGRPDEALAELDLALARAPRRAKSLLGLARAATAAGDAERARATWTLLAEQWRGADPDLPALAEVRAALADAAR